MIKSLSLRAQLVGLSLIVAMLALASAGVALFYLDRATAREQLTQELISTARLLANRSSAALVFLDDATAQENLQALRGQLQVDLVCLYDNDVKLFASFAQVGDSAPRCADGASKAAEAPDTIRVTVPVIGKDLPAGSLVLVSSAKPLKDRMWGQLVSLAVALGSAFAIASLMALGLQKSIVQPITRVRDVATAVIET